MVQVKLVLNFILVYHFYQFRFIYLDLQISHFVLCSLSNWLRRPHSTMLLPLWLSQIPGLHLPLQLRTLSYPKLDLLPLIRRKFHLLAETSTLLLILRPIRRPILKHLRPIPLPILELY